MARQKLKKSQWIYIHAQKVTKTKDQ